MKFTANGFDVMPVIKCKDCRFLKTDVYMKESELSRNLRKEYRCELNHQPNEIYSFFCADGRPKEEDENDDRQ